MDPRRFDSLTRSLAAPKTRRGLLGGLAALAASVRAAAAQNGCPPGQIRNRKGDCNCPAGTDPCPDGCFDKRRDLNNCGKCGRTCLGGTCVKGECRCPEGTVLCNGVCRSQASFADDPNNCTGCGISCDDGNLCTTDTCADGGCVNTEISCDDHDPCTQDSCDPGGGCRYTAISGPACTAASGAAGTCSEGICIATTTTTTTAVPTTTTTTTTSPLLGTCPAGQDTCGTPQVVNRCNGQDRCFCIVSVGGVNLCAQFDESPEGCDYQSCTSDSGCPEGQYCSNAHGNCCGGVCVPPCFTT